MFTLNATRDDADEARLGPTAALVTSWPVFFVFVGLIYLLSARTNVDLTGSDPEFTPLTAHSLIYEHDLDLNEFPNDRVDGHPIVVRIGNVSEGRVPSSSLEFEDIRRQDGRIYDYFPWTTSLFAVPAILAVDLKAATFGGATSGEMLAAGSFGPFHAAVAGLTVAFAALAFRAIGLVIFSGPRLRRRVLATGYGLAFALGTTAWSTASRALWQHGPSMLLAACALLVVLMLTARSDETAPVESNGSPAVPRRTPWRPATLGVLLGGLIAAMVIIRPTNLALGVGICLWLLVWQRRIALLTAVGGVIVAVAFAATNRVLLGTAVPLYYEGSRFEFHSRLLEAIAAQWVSPSRGLLWASPFVVALAAIGFVVGWRKGMDRVLLTVLAIVPLGVTISVSAFNNWWAGHSYGPRLMSEALPPLFVLAAVGCNQVMPDRTRRSRQSFLAVSAVTVLLAWSVVYHGLGATSPLGNCWNVNPTNIDESPERIWSLSDAQFARPFGMARSGHPYRAINGPC